MSSLLCRLLADALPSPPGPPLIGNNLVFYSVVGGVLLLLLLLVLWLRRRRSAPVDPQAGRSEDPGDYPPASSGP
jgi:LPXTG-motif cell wall-anchored protein